MATPYITTRNILLGLKEMSGTAGPHRTILRPTTLPNLIASAVSGVTVSTTQVTVTTYHGMWIRAEDGDAMGQMRQITGYSSGVSVTIHAPFNPSTSTTTNFSIWDTPDSAIATGGGSSTATTVAAMIVPDTVGDAGYPGEGGSNGTDYWLGSYLTVVGAHNNALFGGSALISASVQATGALTHGDIGGTVAAASIIHAYQPMFSGANAVTIEAGRIEQDAATGNLAVVPSVPGPPTWTGDIRVPWRGLTTAAGDGIKAAPDPELAFWLGSQMRYTRTTGEAIVSSTTTAITITTGTSGQFAVGDIVLVNGEATCVTAVTVGPPAVLTVHPALSAAPAAADIVYGLVTFRRDETRVDNFETRGLMQYLGGKRQRMCWGGAWSAKLEKCNGKDIPEWHFSVVGAAACEQAFALLSTGETVSGGQGIPFAPALPAKIPGPGTRLRLVLGTQGSATHAADKIAIISCDDVDLGYSPERADETSAMCGVGAVYVRRGAPAVKATAWMSHDNWESWQRQNKNVSVLLQVGETPTTAKCVYAHKAEVQLADAGVSGGGHTVSITLRPIASGVAGISDFEVTG